MSCGPTIMQIIEKMINNELTLAEQSVLLQHDPVTYFRTLLDRDSIDFVALKVIISYLLYILYFLGIVSSDFHIYIFSYY